MKLESRTQTERRDARENRERIMLAAQKEFAVHGLEAEMKDIAARAGVGVGTLYRHFESRDGLVSAIITEVHDDLHERIKAIAEGRAPDAALREVLRAGAAVLEGFGALFEAALAHEELSAHEHRKDALPVMEALLARGVREGLFRRDLDIDILMASIEAIFVSGALMQLIEARGAEAAADAFADLLLQGCRP
jgi:AcrR family transcriptional regulator